MTSSLKSLGIFGLEAFLVEVEADLSAGLPAFDIVGLPDASVRESRDRVRAALKNCGFDFPVSRITVNLAPADLKKEGPIYDLPILLSLLLASGQLMFNTEDCAFIGELSLNGELRPSKGILPMAILAKEKGIKNLFLSEKNSREAAVVEGINVFGIKSIEDLILHINNKKTLPKATPSLKVDYSELELLDFSQVRGQLEAKRALEIAASGGHNVILIGPPGAGKSMLAKRLPSILPKMTKQEQIETSKIHSIAGLLTQDSSLITQRPFRAPHHTISSAGLSGGGTIPRPGEISLAHNGILFLDELPEFSRLAMEVLRQPIEDGVINISRVSGSVTYPCSIMVVAAMNPCPCGYFGHPTRPCICSSQAISKYLGKISGPLLDRLDIHIEVPSVQFEDLASDFKGESSAEIKKRVNAARKIQNERYQNTNITSNAKLTPAQIRKMCPLSNNAKNLLKKAFEKLSLSARAYDKILKISRTVADLAESEVIKSSHIAETIQYRDLDRKYWLRKH